jgi:hypothetical protein
MGKDLRVDAHQDGDKVQLTARVTGHWGFSWGHDSRGLHIEVRMPREADLQVETSDGSVQAESISGDGKRAYRRWLGEGQFAERHD